MWWEKARGLPDKVTGLHQSSNWQHSDDYDYDDQEKADGWIFNILTCIYLKKTLQPHNRTNRIGPVDDTKNMQKDIITYYEDDDALEDGDIELHAGALSLQPLRTGGARWPHICNNPSTKILSSPVARGVQIATNIQTVTHNFSSGFGFGSISICRKKHSLSIGWLMYFWLLFALWRLKVVTSVKAISTCGAT